MQYFFFAISWTIVENSVIIDVKIFSNLKKPAKKAETYDLA